MENEDQEFWKALLSNRYVRSRCIRELEVQSILSRSAEDLAARYRGEELVPLDSAQGSQNRTFRRSW